MSEPTFGPGARSTPEDVRAGYQIATQLAVYDGNLSWQVTSIFVQFSFILIFGAIFPGFVGETDNEILLAVAGLVVSASGLILTAMFGSMVSRIRTYEGYWVTRAAEYEAQLSGTIETISGSMVLSAEHVIDVHGTTLRMPSYAGVKSRHMLAALFLAFLLAFMALSALNSWRLVASF